MDPRRSAVRRGEIFDGEIWGGRPQSRFFQEMRTMWHKLLILDHIVSSLIRRCLIHTFFGMLQIQRGVIVVDLLLTRQLVRLLAYTPMQVANPKEITTSACRIIGPCLLVPSRDI